MSWPTSAATWRDFSCSFSASSWRRRFGYTIGSESLINASPRYVLCSVSRYGSVTCLPFTIVYYFWAGRYRRRVHIWRDGCWRWQKLWWYRCIMGHNFLAIRGVNRRILKQKLVIYWFTYEKFSYLVVLQQLDINDLELTSFVAISFTAIQT